MKVRIISMRLPKIMTWFKVKLLVACLFSLAPVFASAKVYLVSVGVTDYPGTSMDLTLPAKDAQTITWLYSKNAGMQYCQLLDDEATISKIINAMNKVFSMAGENDIVVLFFSGHGYPGGFCAYDGNLSYREIRKSMAKSECKNKMIFADACFSGKMRTSNAQSQTELTEAKNDNVLLFLSSRSNEVSIERRGMQNGIFTTYLQKGLRGSADANKDRVITAKELFDYVHTNVVKASQDKQHPVMWGKFSDNMPVMVW